ncbi:MAG: serine/threonine-protein kinase, partial [Gammaproteobacteria bacterium]
MSMKSEYWLRAKRDQRALADGGAAAGGLQGTWCPEADADSAEETTPQAAITSVTEPQATGFRLLIQETEPFGPENPSVRPPRSGRVQLAPQPPAPLRVGACFRLIEEVHHGRMSSVWRAVNESSAEDRAEQPIVAVKLVPQQLAPAFDAEALTMLLKISAHPGLVTLLEHGREDAWWYQVAEWIDGETLESLLTSRSDDPALAAQIPRWMRQIAAGLSAQHRAGFVHGDVKAANVLISRGRLGLLDGDAQLIDLVGLKMGTSWTRHGGLTPAFASPDAVSGGPADPRDDVYSLAAMAFQIMAGEPLLQRSFEHGPAPAGLTDTQWRILCKALAPGRVSRTHSAISLVDALWPEPIKLPIKLPITPPSRRPARERT